MINPKLLVIKPVDQLEQVTGLQEGDLLFYDDGPNLKRISTQVFNSFIDNIEDLRNLDLKESQTITLLGYYESGDKDPVNYTYTSLNYNTLVDDGGSIIKTDKGSWIAQFNNKASIKDFGAVDGQNIDTILSKALATSIRDIELPKGTYRMVGTNVIELTSNRRLIGDPQTILVKAAITGMQPFVKVNGDNIEVSNIKFLIEGTSIYQGALSIASGDNILISKCKFENATIGIFGCPEIGQTVSNVKILYNNLKLCKYNMLFGKGDDSGTGTIKKVIISFNSITQGKIIAENGDGIKTTQNIEDLIITHNFIDNPSRDCIDLFASGNKVIIGHNILINAGVKALDIKREPTYSESVYGTNGDYIRIHDNYIGGMSIGVAISGNYEVGNYKSNRFISIHSNIFEKIQTTAISCSGKYIKIYGNDFINNSYSTDTHYPTITVGTDFGTANTVTSNINIFGNDFINNSVSASIKGSVIRVANYCTGISITGNNIINDPDKERPFQDVGIYVNSNSDVLIKDNIIDAITRPLQIVSGATIIGESRSFFLGTKAADVTKIIKLFKFNKKAQLISADYSISTALAADATNYSTANLLIGSTTSVNYNSVTAIDTNINTKLPISTVFMINKGQDISVRYDKAGTGAIFENLMLTVNYIDC